MAVRRFTSEAFPDKDRVSAIQDIWAPVTKIDIAPLDRLNFAVDARALILSGLSIGYGTFSGYRATRSKAQAADSPEDLVFCLLTDASWIARRRRGSEEAYCGPGEVYLNVGNDPSIATVPEPSNTLVNIAVPRAVLASAVADLDAVSHRKLPATPALRLLTGYVTALVREMEALPPHVLDRCRMHIHDLAMLALGATRDAAEVAKKGGLRAARLAAIKTDIAANIARPDLSIPWLAARHGISPQYVRALFNSEQTTFSDFVLRERLARVHRAITNQQGTGRPISAIVFDSGFGDLSYFNRAFRRAYGMTPSEAGEAARRER